MRPNDFQLQVDSSLLKKIEMDKKSTIFKESKVTDDSGVEDDFAELQEKGKDFHCCISKKTFKTCICLICTLDSCNIGHTNLLKTFDIVIHAAMSVN